MARQPGFACLCKLLILNMLRIECEGDDCGPAAELRPQVLAPGDQTLIRNGSPQPDSALKVAPRAFRDRLRVVEGEGIYLNSAFVLPRGTGKIQKASMQPEISKVCPSGAEFFVISCLFHHMAHNLLT